MAIDFEIRPVTDADTNAFNKELPSSYEFVLVALNQKVN